MELPSLGNIGRSFKGTFSKFFNPYSYIELFEEGPKAAVDSVKNLLKSDIKKDPWGTIGNVGSVLFTAGLPALDLAGALNPSREDLKYAGPMEDMLTRLSETGSALSLAHDPFMHGSGTMLGALPAYMLASPIISNIAKFSGRGMDSLMGLRPPQPPPKEELKTPSASFDDSVKQEVMRLRELYPNLAHRELTNRAVHNTLMTAQKYLQNVKL